MHKHILKIGDGSVALEDVRSAWEAISQEDRDLVVEALGALLAERSRAFRIAHEMAVARHRQPPTVDDFELSCILRLQRAIANRVQA